MKRKKNLSQTKEHFEMLIAKKQYENLSKPWYKKLEVWKFAAWSVFTFLSVAVLYHNGLFDFQTKALQAERNALLAQKEYLEYEKVKLSDEQVSMQLASNKMKEEMSMLKQEVAQLNYVKQMAFKSLDERDKLFAMTLMRNRELEKQDHINTEKIKKYESVSLGGSYFTNTARSGLSDYPFTKSSDYGTYIPSTLGTTNMTYSINTYQSIDSNSILKTILHLDEQRKFRESYPQLFTGSNTLTFPSNLTGSESSSWLLTSPLNRLSNAGSTDNGRTMILGDKTVIQIKN